MDNKSTKHTEDSSSSEVTQTLLQTSPRDTEGQNRCELADRLGWAFSPSRSLTRHERLALAVAQTNPVWFLTLTSAVPRSREEMVAAFEEFRRRVERKKATEGPLIYFGAFANGQGQGGTHVHALLWEEPYKRSYRFHGKQLGLNPHCKPITPTPADRLRVTQYVLGQEEAVFGSDDHRHHRPRVPSARSYTRNPDDVLAQWNAQLLHAIERAVGPKDKALPDSELLRQATVFITTASEHTAELSSGLAPLPRGGNEATQDREANHQRTEGEK